MQPGSVRLLSAAGAGYLAATGIRETGAGHA